MFQVRAPELVSMLTRDGVRLDADVYYPDIDGEFPILLMRQPYGRTIASTVVYAHPSWYAAHGYIVVIQDVRGRGSSAGEFSLFTTEINDGEDAVQWAAALPGSTGDVGMYGFSYQGMTQLYAAVNHPTALKTICPAMVAHDLHADWAYEGGAFCLETNLGWALQLAAATAKRQGDETAFLALTSRTANAEVLSKFAPDSFYYDWRDRPLSDPYWQARSPQHYLQALQDLPMLHIGGWFDTYLRGTVKLYRAMQAQSQQPQHLIIGPWAHLPWGRQVGQLDFGEAAVSPVDRLQLRWFDYWLKGIDVELGQGILSEPPLRLFVMGRNEWRLLDQWPQENSVQPIEFHLHPTGLSSVTDGVLSTTLPNPVVPQPDRLVHDPGRPVPSLGGHSSGAAGVYDRAAIDNRADVLTYTTDPLTNPLEIVGEITLTLFCLADVPSWDVAIVLSDIHPQGKVYNFSQGYQRIFPGDQANSWVIKLQPTGMYLAKGHRLRLSLSGACFPAYTVNPGNGESPETSRAIEAQPITLSLFGDRSRPSRLHLLTYPNE
jgi:uncharacterized protein